jgi:undecaprenyl-diphosphatase
VGGDIRRSTCLVTGGGQEPELFVKVVLREWRDGDLLWRAWRRLLRRHQNRPVRVGSPHHEVEHEASMALLAARAGVRTPEVLLVQSFDSGAGMLVQRRVEGHDLAELDTAGIDDALLTEVWRQVGLLHKAGIAHGELVPANVMVDGDGRPWLVDFDQARAAVGSALLERDRAELLEALGALVGQERARRSAEASLV